MAFDGREGFADGAAVVFVDGDEGFVAAAVEEGFVAAAELVPGCVKFVKKKREVVREIGDACES